MTHLLESLKRLVFRPKIYKEPLEAYLHRLPDLIDVSWVRDGNFIAGKISFGDNEFMTQGRSAEEFIEMVNDAVTTYCEIPKDYAIEIKKFKTFSPPRLEIEKLQNLNINKSIISLKRNEKALQDFKVA